MRYLPSILFGAAMVFAPLTSVMAEHHGDKKDMAEKVEEHSHCEGYGPQTPRDISVAVGQNKSLFALAPDASEMNLCNIHTHTNAEHKGPGFSIFVDDSKFGGYACNGTPDLTEAELKPFEGEKSYGGVKPGDTIEVHWVHTSCDIAPGVGLGACTSEACANPTLRVEAQSFLVVNDEDALDFNDFTYSGEKTGDYHQAKAYPEGTGEPVVFHGSTTGPSHDSKACSPLKVTWSVRPNCAKVHIGSLHEWAANDNVFKETKSHGVRELVEEPALLAPIAK